MGTLYCNNLLVTSTSVSDWKIDLAKNISSHFAVACRIQIYLYFEIVTCDKCSDSCSDCLIPNVNFEKKISIVYMSNITKDHKA